MRCRRHNTSRQSGLASVEFAAILPIMLMLMLLTAELGRAFYEYNTLTKMVRNGARYAAEHVLNGLQNTSLSNELQSKIKNLVVNGTPISTGTSLLSGFTNEHVSVEVLQGNSYDEPHIRVSATYRFVPMIGSIPGLNLEHQLNTGYDLQSSVTMRAL